MSKHEMIPSSMCNDNIPSGVGNLLETFAHATVAELRQGKLWYSDAKDEAIRIAHAYGVPLVTVVKVACALSPRLNWLKNMPEAEKVVRFWAAGGSVPDVNLYKVHKIKIQRTKATKPGERILSDEVALPWAMTATRTNVLKALWILQGHDWVLRGSKVQSFLDNILNCETSDRVTVDSHAIQVWLGRMLPGTYGVTEKFYRIIEADYRKAADVVGLSPLQFQAVVWIVKKRLSPARRKSAK